jgi:hypothetical protein
VEEVCFPSPTIPIIVTTKRNNNNKINFHSVFKMMANCKELVLKSLFVHRGRFVLGNFLETLK